jgi:hypothetical protein
MDDSILKKVLKNLGNIAEETGKETVGHVVKMTEQVITAKALLGLESMSDEELAKRKAEDEQQKQKEMAELRAKMAERGRNVEGEIKQVEADIKKEEEQKLRQEQQVEQQQRQEMEQAPAPMESGNPHKRKKKKGSAFVQGKKKSNMPDPSQLSQTAEIAGKME